MLTRDELTRRLAAFQRDANRRLLPAWVAVLFLTNLLPWGVGGYLRDVGGPRWVVHTLGAIGFVGFGFSIWCLGFRTKRLLRAHQLVCPHCGSGLNGPFGRAAQKTGRCSHCEAAVVADPTGEPVAPDPAARKAQDRRLVRLTVVGCALGLLTIWAVWVPLKVMDELPSHLTWPIVVVQPLALFGLVAAMVVLPTRYPRRALALILGAGAVAVAVALVVWGVSAPAFFDPGGTAGRP